MGSTSVVGMIYTGTANVISDVGNYNTLSVSVDSIVISSPPASLVSVYLEDNAGVRTKIKI